MSALNIPLKIRNSSGDLQRFTLSEENYLAYQMGLGISESNDSDVSILTLNSTNANLVGSFTDTFYTDPIGTHPGSSITGPSTSVTSIYQKNGKADSDGANWRFPVAYTDSDDSIREMVDSDFDSLVSRLLISFTTNEYPGCFRLDSDGFSDPDWSARITNAFSDTQTDGTTLNYNIFQRQSSASPTAVRPISIKREGGRTGNYDGGLQEFTDDEIKYTLAQRGKTLIMSNGIGTYQLRSSAQGAPTAPGNWVPRGIAVDTRKEVTDQNFSRAYVSDYTGTFAGNTDVNYSGQYTDEYAGQFTNQYAGQYSRQFTGQFTNQYAGQYTGDYVGVYGGLVNKSYTGSFTGARSFAGSGSFAGTVSAQYTGTVSQQFTGFYIRQYVGQYTATYKRDFSGSYSGTREFTGFYFNNSIGEQFLGTYAGTRFYTGTFTGNFSRQWSGFYGGNVAKSYTGTVSTQYTGTTTVFYGGTRFYTGLRSFSGTYTGQYTRNYAGNFTRQYTGQYARQYAGQYTSQYTGLFSRQYTGNYASQYTGAYTRQYSGLYTGSYSGAAYTAQYAGETIQSSDTGIETYTLYVRTS